MKVINIIDHMGLGGAQVLVKNIFNDHLHKKNIFLYTLRKKNNSFEVNHPNYFECTIRSKFSLAPIKDLKKIIQTNNITMIHCHLFRAQITGIILKLLYFKDITLIFHEHGQIFRYGWSKWFGKKLYHITLRLFKKQINYFFTVSKVTRDIIIKNFHFPANKVKLIYNFIGLPVNKNIKHSLKNKNNILSTNFNNISTFVEHDYIIGFAGRLLESKGWKIFIQGVHQCIKTNRHIKALIAGTGKDMDKLKHYISKHNLSNNVFVMGQISDMTSFYSLLDIFIASSYREAMGLTVVEAQSQGVPVIVSDVPAINELVVNNETGLTFSIKKNELQSKITQLMLNEELRNRLITNGYKNANSFSKQAYYQTLFTFYEQFSTL